MGKSGFLTDLRVVKMSKDKWRLTEPLMYHSELLGKTVVVPGDFVTDFASVPRLPFAYLMTGGKANAASVVHDWLYSSHMFDRATSDAVFKEAIEAEGHGWITANLMWLGVRIGGWAVWSKEKNLPQTIDMNKDYS